MAKQKKNLSQTFFTAEKAILLPLILFIAFITNGITFPFVGYNAWNFNIYSLIAHNYNKFGYISTKFAPVISVSEKLPQHPEYYLHHPQLLSVLESFAFTALGESFWTGRLTVILFAIGSMFLIYMIAKLLYDPKIAFIAACIYVFLPASVLFGKMIGQEPLVLFFVLLAVYSLLLFYQTKDSKYLGLLFISVILGTLSDWPMVYFTICVFPFLYVKKDSLLGLKLILISAGTATLYIIYISSFGALYNLLFGAFLVRSPGALLSEHFWFFKWFITILTRLFFYFNPIVFFITVISLVKITKDLLGRRIRSTDILIISLLFFGFFHILLYPEGSFGHPYWIYYLTPSLVLLTVRFVKTQKVSYSLQLLALLFGIFYLIAVNTWKVKEIEGNAFRYELASRVSKYLHPYEKIIINNNSVIDQDLFLYPFAHSTIQLKYLKSSELVNYDHFVYSCVNICSGEDIESLNKKYYSKSIIYHGSEAIIYFLNKKVSDFEKLPYNLKTMKITSKSSTLSKQNILHIIYNKFFIITGAPQL